MKYYETCASDGPVKQVRQALSLEAHGPSPSGYAPAAASHGLPTST
jgi:hypothetical protein